jgi:hypothetical protein
MALQYKPNEEAQSLVKVPDLKVLLLDQLSHVQ